MKLRELALGFGLASLALAALVMGATPAVCPRGTGEGSLGTTGTPWGAVYARTGEFSKVTQGGSNLATEAWVSDLFIGGGKASNIVHDIVDPAFLDTSNAIVASTGSIASASLTGTVPLDRLSGITSNQIDPTTDAAYRSGGGGGGIDGTTATQIVHDVTDAGFLATSQAVVAATQTIAGASVSGAVEKANYIGTGLGDSLTAFRYYDDVGTTVYRMSSFGAYGVDSRTNEWKFFPASGEYLYMGENIGLSYYFNRTGVYAWTLGIGDFGTGLYQYAFGDDGNVMTNGAAVTNLNLAGVNTNSATDLSSGLLPMGRLTTTGTNIANGVMVTDGAGNRSYTNSLTIANLQVSGVITQTLAGGTNYFAGRVLVGSASPPADSAIAAESLGRALNLRTASPNGQFFYCYNSNNYILVRMTDANGAGAFVMRNQTTDTIGFGANGYSYVATPYGLAIGTNLTQGGYQLDVNGSALVRTNLSIGSTSQTNTILTLTTGAGGSNTINFLEDSVVYFRILHDASPSSPNNRLRIRTSSAASGIDTTAIEIRQDGSVTVPGSITSSVMGCTAFNADGTNAVRAAQNGASMPAGGLVVTGGVLSAGNPIYYSGGEPSGTVTGYVGSAPSGPSASYPQSIQFSYDGGGGIIETGKWAGVWRPYAYSIRYCSALACTTNAGTKFDLQTNGVSLLGTALVGLWSTADSQTNGVSTNGWSYTVIASNTWLRCNILANTNATQACLALGVMPQ